MADAFAAPQMIGGDSSGGLFGSGGALSSWGQESFAGGGATNLMAMSGLSNFLTGIVQTGVGAFTSIIANNAKSEYEQQQLYTGAQLEEIYATEAIAAGDAQLKKIARNRNQIVGAQTASFAGQNVSVSSGSSAEVQADTFRLAGEDMITARNNAWRSAFGHQFKAIEYRTRARQSEIAQELSNKQTLISASSKFVQVGTSLMGIGG